MPEKRIIDLNCKNNNSQSNSQWWNRFAYRKKIMKAIPLDHLAWQIEIRATTWRMCYVAYTNRAVAVYNYTPAEKGGGDRAGHAADWLNAKSLNPIQSHWQQLGSIRRFFCFLRFFCRNRSWQMVDWQLNGSHAFRFGSSSQLKMEAKGKERKQKKGESKRKSEVKKHAK